MPTPSKLTKIPALLLTLMFAGCNSVSPPVVKPDLPPLPPLFGTPSPLPAPLTRGANIKVYAAKMKRAKLLDAQRLRNDKAWATEVLQKYSNTPPAAE